MLFQCDPDIRLARSEIDLDPAEPRKVGIISHGPRADAVITESTYGGGDAARRGRPAGSLRLF
ncbi:MAG TPA: hypothetical protein VGF28_18770 [Thermoanaerobaculia bacterium]|jgi:predicted metal-dependent RNase